MQAPRQTCGGALHAKERWGGEVDASEVFGLGGFAFLPVSLGPAGDCPCKN